MTSFLEKYFFCWSKINRIQFFQWKISSYNVQIRGHNFYPLDEVLIYIKTLLVARKNNKMRKLQVRKGLTTITEINSCALFHILADLPFTTSEREQDYYHQNVNIWVVSLVEERLKEIKQFQRNLCNAWNWMRSTHLATQKEIFNSCATSLQIGCKTLLRKLCVTKFHGYV